MLKTGYAHQDPPRHDLATYRRHKELFDLVDRSLDFRIRSIFRVFTGNEHVQFITEVFPVLLASI